MTREKIKLDSEVSILINCITNDRFLQEMIPIIRSNYFKLGYSKTIWKWIVEYHSNYSCAPKKDITNLYKQKYALLKEDSDEDDAIKLFLSNLSKKYEEYSEINNIDFLLKEAENYLAIRSGEILKEQIEDAILSNDKTKLETCISSYKRVEKPTGQGIDLLHDHNKILEALTKEHNEIITFPGAVGTIIPPICRGDFMSFFGPAKRGKCVTGDTKILLSNGELKRIDEIVKDESGTILSMNKKYHFREHEINNFYYNGIKDVYKIVTKTGRKIKATTNHQFYSFDKKWLSIDEGLQIGNHIACPQKIEVFGDNIIPIDHVRLIAYLLADGGLTGSSPTYTKNDPYMMDEVKRIVESIGDVAYTIKSSGSNTISISKGNYKPDKSNTVKLLMKYGIDKSKSIDKTIPNIILKLSKELIKEFLKVLFSGDGSIYKDNIEYSSGNEQFARQVQHLLLRFGILSAFKTSIAKINNREYYSVQIRDVNNIKLFVSEIGFIGKKEKTAKKVIKAFENKQRQRCYINVIPGVYKKELAQKIKDSGDRYNKVFSNIMDSPNRTCNFQKTYLQKVNDILRDDELQTLLDSAIIWDEIISITYAGKEKTYDITVDKYHNFIANDIVVHNSFWLWQVAELAMSQGNKVIHIPLEMNDTAIIKRIWPSVTGQPLYDKEIHSAHFEDDGNDKFNIVQDSKFIKGASLDNIEDMQKKLRRLYRKGRIKIIPMVSATVQMIESVCDNLYYYENFIPDTIIIDYADYMEAGGKYTDNRDRINKIWKGLRDFANERNIAIITASHTEKKTFDSDIKTSQASEDIRKINHVTLAVSLNATDKENQNNIIRLGMMEVREGRHIADQAVVLQCLDLGRPCIDSKMKKEVNGYNNLEEKKQYKRKI